MYCNGFTKYTLYRIGEYWRAQTRALVEDP